MQYKLQLLKTKIVKTVRNLKNQTIAHCIILATKEKCQNIGIMRAKQKHVWNAEKCVKICWLNHFQSRSPRILLVFVLLLKIMPSSILDSYKGVVDKISKLFKEANWCATNCQKVPKNWLLWTLIAHLHRWWTNIPSKGKVNFVGGFSWP